MQNITISNELWERVKQLLPQSAPSLLGGRPRFNPRMVFTGIFYIKTNNLPWCLAPTCFGSKTTLNDYFLHWAKAGVFHALRNNGILLEPCLSKANLDWKKINSLFGQKGL